MIEELEDQKGDRKQGGGRSLVSVSSVNFTTVSWRRLCFPPDTDSCRSLWLVEEEAERKNGCLYASVRRRLKRPRNLSSFPVVAKVFLRLKRCRYEPL